MTNLSQTNQILPNRRIHFRERKVFCNTDFSRNHDNNHQLLVHFMTHARPCSRIPQNGG